MGNCFGQSSNDLPNINTSIRFLDKTRILSNCCIKKEYTPCHHCKGKGRLVSNSFTN